MRYAAVWIASICVGGIAGTLIRLAITFPQNFHGPATAVMTIVFLAGGPFAIGYVTSALSRRYQCNSLARRIFLPWLSTLLTFAILWLLNLEGWICIAMALPIALVLSSLGGLVGGAAAWNANKNDTVPLACVLLFPILASPVEARLKPPTQLRVVETQIAIHATPSRVWSNMERVRPIAPQELSRTWTHMLGFPRPVAATLSHEGVGGVRQASFEHGVLFIETVNRWLPDEQLAFSIKADTAHIPVTTLDEHVQVGGRYFDVLEGEYRLEPLADGNILLHLSSRERLSTDFNAYAGLWTDAIMKSLQGSILKVIKARCEQQNI